MAVDAEYCVLCLPYRARLTEDYDSEKPGCLVQQLMNEWEAVTGDTPKNKRFACYALTAKALRFRMRETHAACVLDAIRILYLDPISETSTAREAVPTPTTSSEITTTNITEIPLTPTTATETVATANMGPTEENIVISTSNDPPTSKRQKR